jgi:type II secretory pathway pseudopilin PulG
MHKISDKYNNQTGFTLIEITVTIFTFVVLAYGLIVLVSSILTSSAKQSTLLSDSDQARKIAFSIADELRRSQRGTDGSYNLLSGWVNDQQLTFFADGDNQSDIERIRYFSQNGKLYKGITDFNGSIYDTSKEKIYVVQDNLANGSAAIFSYYNGNYYGSSGTPLSLPIDVTDVKFVEVTLKIANKGGVANTNFYTVTAGATLRDLKTNLGN